MNADLDPSASLPQPDDKPAQESHEKSERSRRKKAASKLGWKLIGSDTVEIKVEHVLAFGPRTVTLKGRVQVPAPDQLSAEAGEAALEPIVKPMLEGFRQSVERAGSRILSEPDDQEKSHLFESSVFQIALENAQRGLIREYQELANRRIDEHVEANLGLQFYLQNFPQNERKFYYFVGPTNSGKTYAAIELLRAAESGVYLAPLRLLALEVHEKLNELGVITSLITGEERILNAGSRHVSSTVEMVDLYREVDVAVVDEAQMLQDEQRGWAWTLAIAGVRAKTVVMCGSQDGLYAAERLAAKLSLKLEIRRFERKNVLKVVDAVPLHQLRPGDAVVAFSRSAVVELQGQVGRGGRSTAAIYGSLSPAVRRSEAERFRSGAAEVLVATDAIGLGLNLPIRRLIFATVEKFDGISTRSLTPPEVRQIAGRAGRYGIHEEGQVTALDPRAIRFLRESLEHVEPAPEELPIWISPTDDHLKRLGKIIGTNRLSRLLQFFQTRVLRHQRSDLRIADLSGTIEVAIALELSDAFLSLPLGIRSTYARAPVTTRGFSLSILVRWGEQHAKYGRVEGAELTSGGNARDRLLVYEDRSRLATLYLWLALRFPEVYVQGDEMMRVREQTDDDIQSALLQLGQRPKKHRKAQNPQRRKGPATFDKRRLRK